MYDWKIAFDELSVLQDALIVYTATERFQEVQGRLTLKLDELNHMVATIAGLKHLIEGECAGTFAETPLGSTLVDESTELTASELQTLLVVSNSAVAKYPDQVFPRASEDLHLRVDNVAIHRTRNCNLG